MELVTATRSHKGQKAIVAAHTEKLALRKLAHMLNDANPGDTAENAPTVTAGGDHLVLPHSVLRALAELVQYLSSNQGVVLLPIDQDLTTQEAADMLNVSRPYLIRLINEGQIPCTKTGTHRRLRLTDVLRYKQQRDAGRDAGLTELAQLSQEMGEYD